MSGSVLCVIDLSGPSRKALQWAIEHAYMTKSDLTVLYPYRLNKPQNGESVKEMREKIEEEAQRNFGRLENELLQGGKVSYEFKTEVGFLADRVKEHSKKHPINFLVINKEIRTNHKESFDDLVENSQVPVVIVP